MNILKPHEFSNSEERSNSELPRSVINTTCRSGELLGETVKDTFLTEEEMEIIEKNVPNPEIRKIIKEMIEELGKEILNGKTPNLSLFTEKYYEITGKYKQTEGNYRPYTLRIIGKLPDWTNIKKLLESDNHYSSDDIKVEEFRKKRKTYMNSKINPLHASPDDPIREERPTNLKPKIEKKEVQSYNIKDTVGHYINFPSFTRSEDIETTLPLLKQEDVCIACFQGVGGYHEVTKNTKVPYFDMRDNQKLIEGLGIKKNGEISIPEKIGCIYNPRDDVSHICVFGNEPGGRSRGGNLCTMMVTIKGSVSQKDAIDLIEHIKRCNGLKFDIWNNFPVDANDTDRTNIQKTIVEYLNNK